MSTYNTATTKTYDADADELGDSIYDNVDTTSRNTNRRDSIENVSRDIPPSRRSRNRSASSGDSRLGHTLYDITYGQSVDLNRFLEQLLHRESDLDFSTSGEDDFVAQNQENLSRQLRSDLEKLRADHDNVTSRAEGFLSQTDEYRYDLETAQENIAELNGKIERRDERITQWKDAYNRRSDDLKGRLKVQEDRVRALNEQNLQL
ncbi:hypothetical protein M436DRAFT_68137 [Aureobasidium namibiae CBS 147.97]|uniref:Uncharacterized protein n=1 Tax=Aureobasidium namibiae CBS 147.97 TaxID=1043004 RepID=A0A074W9U4_9PEZI|nr:uncharacterized protein M436DRAFT_68137 [Aureobasidium namibiae CBS 147.97]KEQ68389.1 hypothetical protein M436DRAFT_68137 [Aureobasidium namibiae CBS 147.97]